MIVSFKDAETKDVFETGRNKKFRSIEKVAKRKLDMVQAAVKLDDLKVPPGNNLHALERDREGQHAIKINDQYRVCFTWKEDGIHNVEITDYH